ELLRLPVGRNRSLYDVGRIGRRLTALDRIDRIHPCNYAAELGVVPLERDTRIEHDEELTIRAVLVRRTSQRNAAAHVREHIELGGEVREVRSAPACTGRVASLGHKTVYHAMEDDAVVKALAGERLYALDVARGPFGHQTDRYTPAVRQVEEQDVFEILGQVGVGRKRNRASRGRVGLLLSIGGRHKGNQAGDRRGK